MIISALRTSIVFRRNAHPDLTVGAISYRRFAPPCRDCDGPLRIPTVDDLGLAFQIVGRKVDHEE
jgi:hypothetical protein